ncbi:MAG: glycoside hydrolase family 3 N-terminal domain-containing protein [Bacteroidota bacterium]
MNKSDQETKDEIVLQNWLAQLNLEQKVGLIVGRGMDIPGLLETEDEIRVAGQAASTLEIPELGIPSIILADGPAGLRIAPKRVGTDATFYCTAFPVATLLASTWDKELVKEIGAVYGKEAKEYGVDIVLAPGMNIHRNPLAGRNFEYYSEDPYLSGHIAAAMVKGIQAQGVGTSIKHFVANNSETNRSMLDTVVSERALREIYLRGFEIAVKEAQPRTVMSAYNKINGTYASESYYLLENILRLDWGFKGAVMTDWFGGKDPIAQMIAGNDWLMPGEPKLRKQLIEAVESGALQEEILDQNVERILRVIISSPSYHKYPYSNQPDLKQHALVARKAAAEGAILLKNEKGTLPLSNSKMRIAAFGVGSYDFIAGGTGSGDVNKAYTISLVEGLNNASIAIDTDLQESYESYITNEKAKLPEKAFFFELPPPIPEMTLDLIAIQAIAAKNDIALLTIGRNSGEFQDRQVEDDFNLRTAELALIQSVSEVFRGLGKRVVVLLNIGNVIELMSWRDCADAILLPWQGGQEAGNALTDVLIGKVNPSGKLPTSFPQRYADVPSAKSFPGKVIPDGETHELGGVMTSHEMEITFDEDIWVGYRHYLSKAIPTAYPFGFGLSYTSFSYQDLIVDSDQKEGGLKVNVTIQNTGDKAGKEVVQLYIAAPLGGKLEKPLRELKAFAKTKLLQPQESETLTFLLQDMDLASFDTQQPAWIIEGGQYSIQICASSQDVRLEKKLMEEAKVVERVPKALTQKM